MDNTYTMVTKSAQETAGVAEALARHVLGEGKGKEPSFNSICLYGALGAGKTTFTQGFARGLGIGTRLLSPTFIIVRRYSIPKNSRMFYHMDLYRVEGQEALEALGIDEIFAYPDALVVVEWAEKLGDLLPDKRIEVHLSVQNDGKHQITIKYY